MNTEQTILNQEFYYDVAEYEGNIYYRIVHKNDTTVYMDKILSSFYTEEEAIRYIEDNE